MAPPAHEPAVVEGAALSAPSAKGRQGENGRDEARPSNPAAVMVHGIANPATLPVGLSG